MDLLMMYFRSLVLSIFSSPFQAGQISSFILLAELNKLLRSEEEEEFPFYRSLERESKLFLVLENQSVFFRTYVIVFMYKLLLFP